MSSTARSANASSYLAHDCDFHRTMLVASGNPMLAGLADVVVQVLVGRTRHSLMPAVAEPYAIRLYSAVASSIQAGDGTAADDAMRAIVVESADIAGENATCGHPEARVPLPSVLSASSAR